MKVEDNDAVSAGDVEEYTSSQEDVNPPPAKRSKALIISDDEEEEEAIQVGTFVGEFDDSEGDDIMMAEIADELETSFTQNNSNRAIFPNSPEVYSVDSASDQDTYDTDDSFIDDDNVSSGEEISSHNDTEEEEEEDVLKRMHDFTPPDPGLHATLTSPKRKSKTKRKKGGKSVGKYEDILDVQEVSIHRINTCHRAFKKCKENEENIIQDIIDKQNCKRGQSDYEEKKVTQLPKMNEADESLFENYEDDEFQIKVFVQTVKKKIALLSAYGVRDVSSDSVHSIIFHYRENEIFALTTNQAWNVVQWCSEFSFPGKVAARILSRDGALEITKKGLLGTDLMSKRSHKKVQESNPFDLLTFCTGFTTLIADNASILKLQCFLGQESSSLFKSPMEEEEIQIEPQPSTSTSRTDNEMTCANTKSPGKKKQKPSPKQTAKCQVSQAAVRFLKRLRVSDYLAILNHLSLIARGKPTTTYDGMNEEDSSAHDQYLQPVHIDIARQLDVDLSTEIHNAIASRSQNMGHYELVHKHYTDFLFAQDFSLKFGHEKVGHWKHCPPTCSQIILALRRINELVDVSASTTPKKYMEILEKCKLAYTVHDYNSSQYKWKTPEKLINFFQGMLYRRSDNNVYWHIQGIWCYLQPTYMLLIQREFCSILSDHLYDCAVLGLTFSWPRLENVDEGDEEEENENHDPNKDIKNYLVQYSNSPDYYVSDDAGDDIVDAIKIRKTASGKEMLGIFYILPSFNHKFSAHGVRITDALINIQKTHMAVVNSNGNGRKQKGVGGSEKNIKNLTDLYDKVIANKPEFLRLCPTFSMFRKMMGIAPIVLGIKMDKLDKSLSEEKITPTTIEVEHIDAKLLKIMQTEPQKLRPVAQKLGIKPNNCLSLAKAIHELLLQNELISFDNTITCKFVTISSASIVIPELGGSASFIYDSILKPFQPPASAFLAKLELIRIQRVVQKLGIKQFFIAEIGMDD